MAADKESNGTATGAGSPAGGVTFSNKSGGLPWAEVQKYAKEMAGPAEANSIGEGI